MGDDGDGSTMSDGDLTRWEPAKPPPLPEHTSQWELAYFQSFGPDIEEHAKRDKNFANKLLQNRAILSDMLRYEAVRRAIVPVYRPIYQRGQLVGHEEVRDNKHLEWMLERLDPDEFNLARKVEMSGKGGTPIKFAFSMGEGPEINADDGEFEESDA